MNQKPRVLTDDNLQDMARELATARALGDIDPSGDRLFVLDSIQRMYSDDGRGGGRFTLHGMAVSNSLTSLAGDYRDDDGRDVTTLGMLLTLAPWLASRAQSVEVVERWHALTLADASRPLWELLAERPSASQYIAALNDGLDGLRYMPIGPLFTDLSYLVRIGRVFQAEVEALETAIALELSRRHHGAYPDDLADLVPRYRPGVPVDHSTGLPLCYRLVDGRPVLYGRGLDGDDDGGRRPAEDKSALDEGVEGDWILYPPEQ
jgi:hypothetical protein